MEEIENFIVCAEWKNGPIKITRHEITKNCVLTSIKASYKEAAFPLNPSLKEIEMKKIVQNKEVIRHLIDIVLYLGRHCLPFRGHKDLERVGKMMFVEILKI